MSTLIPVWAQTILRPGYELVDGIVSYHPKKLGAYMTGGPSKWPEVTAHTPHIKGRPTCVHEFSNLIARLRSDGPGEAITLLSVCDGGGYPSTILAAEHSDVRVIALDLASDALRYYAPKSIAYLGVEEQRMVRVHASALDLPLADESVDGVVGVAAIHHLQLLHTFFAEVARVLRAGGGCQFASERIWNGAEPNYDVEEDITRTAGQYRRALEDQGRFESVVIRTGDGELWRYSQRTRLPLAVFRQLRPFVPRLLAATGRNASVSVSGWKAGR